MSYPSCRIRNSTQSLVSLIVFNPADIIRSVDAGQHLIKPGEVVTIQAGVLGNNFSFGVCFDTYYKLTDQLFGRYWTSWDTYGVAGNWLKYRLFHVESDDLDQELIINRLDYCVANGDGISIIRARNQEQVVPQPFYESHYREVSLGIFLCVLAPIIQLKNEAEMVLLGGQVFSRMNSAGTSLKDGALLACMFCRLYHLDGMNLSSSARDFLRELGIDQNYDNVKGEMTSKDVEQVLVILMKMNGATDRQIDQLYSQLNMDPSIMLDCWWKFTQGNVQQGQGTGGQSLGKMLGSAVQSMAGGQAIDVGSGGSGLSGGQMDFTRGGQQPDRVEDMHYEMGMLDTTTQGGDLRSSGGSGFSGGIDQRDTAFNATGGGSGIGSGGTGLGTSSGTEFGLHPGQR